MKKLATECEGEGRYLCQTCWEVVWDDNVVLRANDDTVARPVKCLDCAKEPWTGRRPR